MSQLQTWLGPSRAVRACGTPGGGAGCGARGLPRWPRAPGTSCGSNTAAPGRHRAPGPRPAPAADRRTAPRATASTRPCAPAPSGPAGAPAAPAGRPPPAAGRPAAGRTSRGPAPGRRTAGRCPPGRGAPRPGQSSQRGRPRPAEQRRQVFLGVHQGLGPLRSARHLRQLPLELGDLPVAGIDRRRLAPALLRRQGGPLPPPPGPAPLHQERRVQPLAAEQGPDGPRRRGFATTCTSSCVTVISRASMGSSRLALLSNFGGRDCLTHPGTEGDAGAARSRRSGRRRARRTGAGCTTAS